VSSEVEPDCVVVPTLCPGITDVRYFRERGAQGYGWVPVTLTEELLRTVHSHDERIPVASFERGVEAITEVVRRAAA
jgi:acetylornithine deacetylase/succinyl-diaminopimelate desuccinylase-like protein